MQINRLICQLLLIFLEFCCLLLMVHAAICNGKSQGEAFADKINKHCNMLHSAVQASKSSSNLFVSGAEGMKFKSRASQIGYSVANGSPLLRYFFKRTRTARAQNAEIGLANSSHSLA